MGRHFGRQAEAGHVDLADEAGIRHGLGRGNDTNRGRGRDYGEIGMRSDQALGLTVGLVEQVVAINGRHDFDAGELAIMLLGSSEPGVLVRRGCGARDERQLALAFRQFVGSELDDGAADQIDRGRIELHVAAFRCHARVERNDGNAAFLGLLQGRNQRIRVVRGDDDGVHLLRDQGVDHLDLAFGGRLGRAGEDDLDIAELLGRFVGALAGSHEEAVADVLGDDGDAGLCEAGRGGRDQRESGNGGAEAEGLEKFHRGPPVEKHSRMLAF